MTPSIITVLFMLSDTNKPFILRVIMVNVIMLNVIMVSVILLNVVMPCVLILNVVVPRSLT